MNLPQAMALCRAMPGAREDEKWGGTQVFTIGLKMFALVSHGRGEARLSFKVEDGRFLELTDRPGIVPAPYLARAKWVQITAPEALDDREAAALLQRAYQLVFSKLTKKLQRDMEGQEK
ncbi:MmcQ/YjbR family DNA-binding protein [Janthinobacterium sp.]|uniref:MmcQ/YjbR family DNA-binding protein n=1 Tax=Janthinobacterium sp. TaxID=1871054 RepID=UPI00293D6FE2|nr:MmcQ/YjbR family DNA-binding protein [Janthinobacterium sp.]